MLRLPHDNYFEVITIKLADDGPGQAQTMLQLDNMHLWVYFSDKIARKW